MRERVIPLRSWIPRRRARFSARNVVRNEEARKSFLLAPRACLSLASGSFDLHPARYFPGERTSGQLAGAPSIFGSPNARPLALSKRDQAREARYIRTGRNSISSAVGLNNNTPSGIACAGARTRARLFSPLFFLSISLSSRQKRNR